MFTKEEWKLIIAGLTMSAKSAARLSNRADQPESVAMEYKKVIGDVQALMRKCITEAEKVKK